MILGNLFSVVSSNILIDVCKLGIMDFRKLNKMDIIILFYWKCLFVYFFSVSVKVYKFSIMFIVIMIVIILFFILIWIFIFFDFGSFGRWFRVLNLEF